MAGQPVVFQPGAVCPVGYLCIPGMEPMKLPDVQPDIQPDVQGAPDDVILPTVAGCTYGKYSNSRGTPKYTTVSTTSRYHYNR